MKALALKAGRWALCVASGVLLGVASVALTDAAGMPYWLTGFAAALTTCVSTATLLELLTP